MTATHARAMTFEAVLLIAIFGFVSYTGMVPTGAAVVESAGLGAQHVIVILLLIALGVFFAVSTREAVSALRASHVELAPLILRKGPIPPIRPPPPPRPSVARRLEHVVQMQGRVTRTLWAVVVSGLRGELPAGQIKRREQPVAPKRGFLLSLISRKSKESAINEDLDTLNRRIRRHLDELYR